MCACALYISFLSHLVIKNSFHNRKQTHSPNFTWQITSLNIVVAIAIAVASATTDNIFFKM